MLINESLELVADIFESRLLPYPLLPVLVVDPFLLTGLCVFKVIGSATVTSVVRLVRFAPESLLWSAVAVTEAVYNGHIFNAIVYDSHTLYI